MSHSVSGHLALDLADYDREIRRLVPAYAAMRPVQLEALAIRLDAEGPARVLDLGGGTGALAEAVAERFPRAEVEIWDTDPGMMEVARRRCARFGTRIRLVERSFTEPLTPCDAVAACISLHHVKDMSLKGGIYRNIFAALRPGGLFVNADTSVATAGPLREHAFAQWTRDMEAHGIDAAAARAHFVQWAKEDFYPPVIVELDLLRQAGFAEPECVWRQAAAVVYAAVR